MPSQDETEARLNQLVDQLVILIRIVGQLNTNLGMLNEAIRIEYVGDSENMLVKTAERLQGQSEFMASILADLRRIAENGKVPVDG